MKTGLINEPVKQVSFKCSDAKATLCIWLVDDDADCRERFTLLLNGEPCINCSRSFSSAISLLAALAQESPPDVILLDAQMPLMDGIEAVRPIKNLAPTTLILMLTTFFDAQLMKDALVAGVVDLLLKGNSPAQIIAAIRRATVQLRLP